MKDEKETVEQPTAMPDVDELLQENTGLPAVAVSVAEPVTVHNLPSHVGTAESVTLGTDRWEKVLPADPKRKRATLIAYGTAADPAVASWVYSRTGSGTENGGMPWPAGVPLVIEHADQVYARAQTGTTAATLSVLAEVWAD